VLERAAMQVASIARTLAHVVDGPEAGTSDASWLRPDQLGGPLCRLVGSAGQALRTFADGVAGDATPMALEEARAVAAARRQVVIEAARARLAAAQPTGWIALGTLVDSVDRLVEDLAVSTAP
jgi:hypothetical protein